MYILFVDINMLNNDCSQCSVTVHSIVSGMEGSTSYLEHHWGKWRAIPQSKRTGQMDARYKAVQQVYTFFQEYKCLIFGIVLLEHLKMESADQSLTKTTWSFLVS